MKLTLSSYLEDRIENREQRPWRAFGWDAIAEYIHTYSARVQNLTAPAPDSSTVRAVVLSTRLITNAKTVARACENRVPFLPLVSVLEVFHDRLIVTPRAETGDYLRSRAHKQVCGALEERPVQLLHSSSVKNLKINDKL